MLATLRLFIFITKIGIQNEKNNSAIDAINSNV